MNKSKEKVVVVMRHGERTDLVGAEVKLNYSDPELTDHGKSQAYNAGRRLREILEEMYYEEIKYVSVGGELGFLNVNSSNVLNKKKVALISSPFSRTLETAVYAKNGLGLNSPIFVENGLAEFISNGWFRSSPKNFLCYLQLYCSSEENKEERMKIEKPEYFIEEMMNDIILYQPLQPLPEFPESTNKCISRFHTTLDLILYYYAIRKDFDILILFSHVFGIQTLCEKMEIPMDYFEIEYCSTFVFKYDPETGKFTFEKNFFPISSE